MNCDEIHNNDLIILLDQGGTTKMAVESYNRFVSHGVPSILSEGFNTEKTIVYGAGNAEGLSAVKFAIKFVTKQPKKPTKTNTGEPIYPNECIISDTNYTIKIECSATVTVTGYKTDKNSPPLVRTETMNNFAFALPVMTGTDCCNTTNLTDAAKMVLGEDPLSPPGMFVISGGRYCIDVMESRAFNTPNIFRNIGHNAEVTRLEILSKAGDGYENSAETVVRYKTDGGMYVSLTSDPGLKELEIPIQLLFKVLGFSDREVFDNVVMDYGDTQLNMRLFDMLNDVFHTYDKMSAARELKDSEAILSYIAEIITDTEDLAQITKRETENSRRLKLEYNRSTVESRIDRYFIPHMGTGADSRFAKGRYLGYLVRRMFLVYLQKEPETDRDHHGGKRYMSQDRSMAKVFKTMFNFIIKKIRKGLTEKYETMKFFEVPIVQILDSASSSNTLETSITKAIVSSGKDTSRDVQAGSSISAQQVPVKNPCAVMSTLNTFRAPNKSTNNQTAVSKSLRNVQPTQIGTECLSRTADTGSSVGTVKESIPGTIMPPAGSSMTLVNYLKRDPLVVRCDRVFPADIYKRRLTMVFVNGIWVGCTQYPRQLRAKYVELRRGNELYVTETDDEEKSTGQKKDTDKKKDDKKKEWDWRRMNKSAGGFSVEKVSFFERNFNVHFDYMIGELHFWIDFGRVQCPRMIVRCNDPHVDPVGAEHFRRLGFPPFDPTKPPRTVEADVKKGGKEKTGKEGAKKEAEHDNFVQDVLVTKEDVDALFNRTKTVNDLHKEGKIDYVNANELCDCYIAQDLNDLRRNKHNLLRQFTHVEVPAVAFGLMADTCPFITTDQAARTSMQTNQGKHSVSINTANHVGQFEKRAMSGDVETPLVVTVANVLCPVSNTRNTPFMIGCVRGYNQEDSLITDLSAAQRGMFAATYIHTLKVKVEGAIIGVLPGDGGKLAASFNDFTKLAKNGVVREGAKIKSGDILVAKYIQVSNGAAEDKSFPYSGEPAQVIGIFNGHNKKGERIIKIKIVIFRPLTYGDKFSSRHGQKGMNAKMLRNTMLPSVNGYTATKIMSPFAVPTRMTIGQLLEMLISMICVARGCHFDASPMAEYDSEKTWEEAERLEIAPDAVVYDGMTGMPHTGMAYGMVAYQRLAKWAADEHYAISYGNTDPVTKQPVEGKARGGAFRLGEMEKDVMVANACVKMLLSKFQQDSDGRTGYVCRNCGGIPIVNEREMFVRCKRCEARSVVPDVVKTMSSAVTHLILAIVNSMGIGFDIAIKPSEFLR